MGECTNAKEALAVTWDGYASLSLMAHSHSLSYERQDLSGHNTY